MSMTTTRCITSIIDELLEHRVGKDYLLASVLEKYRNQKSAIRPVGPVEGPEIVYGAICPARHLGMHELVHKYSIPLAKIILLAQAGCEFDNDLHTRFLLDFSMECEGLMENTTTKRYEIMAQLAMKFMRGINKGTTPLRLPAIQVGRAIRYAYGALFGLTTSPSLILMNGDSIYTTPDDSVSIRTALRGNKIPYSVTGHHGAVFYDSQNYKINNAGKADQGNPHERAFHEDTSWRKLRLGESYPITTTSD